MSRPVLDVQPHLISAMAWEHSRDALIVGRLDGSLGVVHVVVSPRGIVIDKKELDCSRRECSKSKLPDQTLYVAIVFLSLVPVSSISCSSEQPMIAVGFEDGAVCILVSDGDRSGSIQYVVRCQHQADQVHVQL